MRSRNAIGEQIMVCWKLSQDQMQALEALRQSTYDTRVVRNVMVILLSGQGRSKEWLAEKFECSLGTVNNIRRGYRLRGLAGLKPAPRAGRRSRATPLYRTLLRQVAQSSPQKWGYPVRFWSARRLGEHLERETGISFGEDQIRRLLLQEGMTPRRYRRAHETARPLPNLHTRPRDVLVAPPGGGVIRPC